MLEGRARLRHVTPEDRKEGGERPNSDPITAPVSARSPAEAGEVIHDEHDDDDDEHDYGDAVE